tara:strand:+ start:5433 stop:5801 length:369 start_codon:yes stop_codon:yes gene_type:complete
MFLIILVTSSTAKAGFLETDFDLNHYLEIRNYDGDHQFYKMQRVRLRERAAGIYFSMKEEGSINILTGRKSLFCIGEESIDMKAFLSDLDNEIKNNKDFYPKMTFTKAVRKLIIRRRPCPWK